MLINMTILPYLETFVAVVENGSFTAAAKALGISKPVVSKQVSHLEQSLGVQLLQRSTRRMHLTEAGEIFTRYAQGIVEDAKEAEQSVLPLQSEPQGRLRISAPESLVASLLPNVLLGFQQRFPKVELDMRVSGRFADLIEEGIDVALRIGDLDDSAMIARRLMTCHFHVCAAPDYWRKQGKPDHPDALQNHNCLIYTQSSKPDTWFFKDTNGDDFSVKVSGNLSTDAGMQLLDAVLASQGVMLAPSYMIANLINEGRIETVLENFSRDPVGVFAIYPQSKLISPKVRAFIDHCIDHWNNK